MAVILAIGSVQAFIVGAAASAHQPAECRDVTYRGELGTRYGAATYNLVTRPDRYSLDSFRANATCAPGALWVDWPGDQFGRWFSVLHVAEGYGWTPASRQRAAIADVILPAQTKQGNFGRPLPFDQQDARVPSGNAFALRGLLDAYEDSGDERLLDAARRLARYFQQAAPYWRETRDGHLHEYFGHCIDGLVHLCLLGGDEFALELAKDLASRAGRTAHTHHSLSMYRGVLELYQVTGDKRFLASAEDYLAWCKECRTVDGALPEMMPASEQDEGCATADYVVTNLMAFRATGRDAYVDEAERVLVNHMMMTEFRTGGFGHRAFGQEVLGGRRWQGWDGQFGSENPGCCSLWGQWALGQVGRFIVTDDEGAVEVNLYPEATVEPRGRGVRIDIASDFPRTSHATVAVHCDTPAQFALRLRVPAWVESGTITVDGKTKPLPKGHRRVVVEREWRSGDTVELRFDAGLRLVRWPAADSALVAVFDGPLCLGLSSAVADVNTYRRLLVGADGRPVTDAQGRPVLVSADGRRLAGLAPVADDWLTPDVHDPNDIRVLFEETKG